MMHNLLNEVINNNNIRQEIDDDHLDIFAANSLTNLAATREVIPS
jgi:hypothetical protein